MSGAASETPLVTQTTGNGQIPTVSRSYTFSLSLSVGIPQTFDLRAQQNINVFKGAQGIFIDNSANATACALTFPSGQNLICPPQSQAIFPIYLPVGTPVIEISGAGTVNFVLINFPTPAQVWNVNGQGIYSGGTVAVYDAAVASNTASALTIDGGGIPSGMNQMGGQYSAVVNFGTLDAVAFRMTEQGNLKVANGGQNTTLNISAATVVKSSAGRIGSVVVNTPPTSPAYVIDSAGTTEAASNLIMTIGTTVAAGTVFNLDWPCQTGIAIVPNGGNMAIKFD